MQTCNWTNVVRMNSARCYVGACVLKGQLVVIAGYDGNRLLNCLESYDPILERWQVFDDQMSVPRCDAGVAVVRRKYLKKETRKVSSYGILINEDERNQASCV